MIIKFNRFERVAGLFVGLAILGTVVLTAGVAVKKGWFSSKIAFETKFKNADGIHTGTVVNVSGVRAGVVTDIDLVSVEEVRVKFEVLEKFHQRIRLDSTVQQMRPFIIGEKILDVSIGSDTKDIASRGAILASKSSIDMMDLVSGRHLGPVLESLEGLFDNMKTLLVAFSSPKRTQAFVEMFDRLTPLLINMNRLTDKMANIADTLEESERMSAFMDNMILLTSEMNKVMPELNKLDPQLASQIHKVITHLSSVLSGIGPAVSEVGTDLPRASKRAIEALDEAVVLLKAMQKSFFLSGNVEDVREEEARRFLEMRKKMKARHKKENQNKTKAHEENRTPANEPNHE